MMKLLMLVAGGALGTLLRYGVSGLAHKYVDGSFPLGTLLVNLIGSFFIGFFWGLWETASISPALRTFIFVGMLGAFTTFSTYSLETLSLFRGGEMKWAIANILANNILGLLLVFLGFTLSRLLLNMIR